MKKVLSLITIIMFFVSMNTNAVGTTPSESQVFIKKTCFAFYHEIFYEYYGGINIDNVGDFNYLVAQCQAAFESK